MKFRFIFYLFLILATVQAKAAIIVCASAGSTDVMRELAAAFEQSEGTRVHFNFAGSGALARQLEAGAPADVFVSANQRWMDYLAEKDLLKSKTRRNVALNSLVLIAPKNSLLDYEGFPANVKGRLAIGDPKSVPAGSYAKAALESLGFWNVLESKLVKGQDVRTALAYVERGEVDAGIVYASDAMRSTKVTVLGTFPDDSHPAVVFTAACLKRSSADAQAFLEFMGGAEAAPIWTRYGFRVSP